VDFVDKEYGPLSVEPPPFVGVVNDFPYVFDPGQNCVKAFENAAGSVGNATGQAGLACSRRAVKNNGRKAVGLYGPAQKPARADYVILAYDIVKGPWPHAIG
jgi:hypothetical protein